MIGRSEESINDILAQIIRAKRANSEDCILFVNQSLYDAMEEAGAIVHWKENHPGAIWMHCDICGCHVVIDNEIEGFSVMPLNEARKRIKD